MLVPVMGLFLTANGAFTEATYEDFKNGACTAEDVTGPPCDLSGETKNNVPELDVSFGATFEDQIFNLPFILHVGTDFGYSSEMFTTRDLDPLDVRNEVFYVDGRIGIRSLNENWHIMLFGTNLTDQEIAAGSDDVPTFRGSHFGGPYPGRQFEIEARFSF